jgi:hypothetical protein
LRMNYVDEVQVTMKEGKGSKQQGGENETEEAVKDETRMPSPEKKDSQGERIASGRNDRPAQKKKKK